MKDMKDRGYEVKYDSSHEDTFNVHMQGKVIQFKCNAEGLYEYEVSDDYKDLIADSTQHVNNYVTTVKKNMQGYTPCQFERAKEARNLYNNMGSHTIDNFKSLY